MKIVEQRIEFVRAVERDEKSFSALCEDFGISRKTGYKWLNRYAECEEVDALKDQSRAPCWSKLRVDPPLAYEICELRRKYPHWGPKKLLVRLPPKIKEKYELPSLSTTSRILKREGLIRPRKSLRKTPPYTKPFKEVIAPNQLWCIDFKGHFKLRNGQRIYPLTITDAYSRYLLCCEVLAHPKTMPVFKIMEKIFRSYGLPEAIRSDNGVPFATVGTAGLSELNVWWTKLEIRHERIEPGKPQQNGRHERMHLTLKNEACLNPALTPRGQQLIFNEFQREYNFERPHEALNMKTPSEIYVRSARIYSPHLLESSFPKFGLAYAQVQNNGSVEWNGYRIEIGKVLKNQIVEIAPVSRKKWVFKFGPHLLGLFDERKPSERLVEITNKKVLPMS